LADRFDITIAMGRPDSAQAVINILAGQNGNRLPVNVVRSVSCHLENTILSEAVRQLLAKLYIDYNLESLRTVTAMETAARLVALQAGRTEAGLAELVQVAPWALAHRVNENTLAAIMEYLNGQQAELPAVALPVTEPVTAFAKKTISRWTALWYSLKRRVATLLQGQLRMPGCGRSSRGGGGAQFVDPLHTKIIAPPKSAIPLSQLPDEQLVTRNSKPHV